MWLQLAPPPPHLRSGNPGSAMSPAGATSLEEQQYMEKLKQLSKYIEPLRRMINKIDKNEGELLTFDLCLQMISSSEKIKQ